MIDSFVTKYFHQLESKILKVIGSKNIEFKGPTYRNRANNLTLSYNIYPDEYSFSDVWTGLYSELRTVFNDIALIGEVITYTAKNGTIQDQGTVYFRVLEALLFECYIYDPESFIYARLLHEYDVLKKNEWISIDIDGIYQSAWFEE